MKVFKWVSVITITAAATCILLFTFTQEPFGATAPIKIFWHDTANEFPIYVFIAAAFVTGLLIGFFAAAYYYIKGQAGIHNTKKEVKRLEGVVEQMTGELDKLRTATAKAQERITKSQKAVGEKDLLI